jgi:hypothetical protein
MPAIGKTVEQAPSSELEPRHPESPGAGPHHARSERYPRYTVGGRRTLLNRTPMAELVVSEVYLSGGFQVHRRRD